MADVVVTLSELQDQMSELLTKVQAATLNAESPEDWDKIQTLMSDRKKIQSAIRDYQHNIEKDARTSALEMISEALIKGISFPSDALGMSVTLRRGENGIFDNLDVKFTEVGNRVTDVIHAAFPENAVADLSSVKGIKFSWTAESGITDLAYTGSTGPRKSSSNGNGKHGRGWIKDGITRQLGDVWQEFATDEDIEKRNNANSGGAKYGIQKAVASRHGFEMAEPLS